MIDLAYLERLLPLLAQNSIRSIKMAGLELELGSPVKPPDSVQASPSPQGHTINAPEPPGMPPDLKIDAIQDFDKVLNWSAPDPGMDESPMPLTGEDPGSGAV